MAKPSVIHLIASNFFGGPEKQVYNHALLQREGKYEIIIASFADTDNNEIVERANAAGIRSYLIPSSHPFDPRQIKSIVRIIKETEASIICTHNYKPRTIGGIAAKLCGIPHVAVCRGRTWENRKVAFYNWLDWKIMRYVNRVVAVSDGMREQLCQSGIKGRLIVTIHNAINAEKFRAEKESGNADLRTELGIDKSICIYATIGRLSPEKGHIYLIDAFKEVYTQHPKSCLVICGDGVEEEKLRSRARELGIESVVHFIGFRRDISNILSSSDVMVLPSLSEGLPNVVLEAFSIGIPVVATRVGGVPELVIHDDTGLLCESADPQGLAEQMSRLADNANLRASLSESAYRYVLDEFTFDKQTKKLEALYNEILS